MVYPKFISSGSCIGVPAPSASARDDLDKAKYKNAVKRFEDLGYKLFLSNNLFNCIKARSASSVERAKEVNDMFENSDINMIICLAGGEFLVEILPFVDFNLIKDNPKYVAGFSDPTGLLYPLTTKYDIATIYGHNFSHFGVEPIGESEKSFLEIIKGNIIKQNSYPFYEETSFEKVTGLEPDNLVEKVYWKTLDGNEVNLKGRIIGGCFDLISELAGTKYDGINQFNERYKDDGIIWYFDNCEFSMEEVIRTLWKMNELDYFKYAKGVIFGRFGILSSSLDYDTKTCLEDSVLSKLDIPIIYDADISHKAPCLTIINGSIATIHVSDGKGSISFELI